MKKFFKWLGIILLILILAGIGGVYFLINKADAILAAKYEVDPPVFLIPNDSLSLVKGEKLAILCTDCHGSNHGGSDFFNDKQLGIIYAPNLTKGLGSAVKNYSDKDWIRAIRHGIRPNGDGLLIMPSIDYYQMSQNDVSALIAYLKQIPHVDHETGETKMTSFGKVLLALGAFGETHSANILDHSKPAGADVIKGANKEYGKYLIAITGCKSCHQGNLKGGKHPDPNSPPVPDITSSGNLGHWSQSQFINTMYSGTTPENKVLDKKYMPYLAFSGLEEDDLKAIQLYLSSL
jgi:mono/diheme cytochrome c family protein